MSKDCIAKGYKYHNNKSHPFLCQYNDTRLELKCA